MGERAVWAERDQSIEYQQKQTYLDCFPCIPLSKVILICMSMSVAHEWAVKPKYLVLAQTSQNDWEFYQKRLCFMYKTPG